MTHKISAPQIQRQKGQTPIVCITAYDALETAIADEAGVDLILVGDSVGNVKLGLKSTVHVTMDMMRHHVSAASRANPRALLVGDLPIGSFQTSPGDAVLNSLALVQSGADAVKLEGTYPEAISAIVKAGIPVMGHLGMTPQRVLAFGGHKVQMKADGDAERLLEEAIQIAEAGCFAIVLELVPETVAEFVTRKLPIPTIGIGAGRYCDGQIQVIADVLGLSSRKFRHAKPYLDGRQLFQEALTRYTEEVRASEFPTEDNAV